MAYTVTFLLERDTENVLWDSICLLCYADESINTVDDYRGLSQVC